MFDYYFTFQSISRAQQALFALTENSLQAELTKSPKKLSPYGCSYALKLPQQSYYPALLILQNCGMAPQHISHLPKEEHP